jgi:two-component system, NarL family, nitrate/nitrite response regulator NarL
MPDSVEPIRILLIDDHALFRESVARFLGSEPGFQVVGECGSVEEALETLRHERVDIVLLDVDLGGRDGLQFMQWAKQRGFGGQVLIVTAGVGEDKAAELIRTGVSGIFMKHKSALLLAQAIHDVMAGKVWFDRALLRGAVTRGARPPAETQFTLRERQVFSNVLEGLANKEIAGRIGVSESSVKATLQQLFSKTGVRTRSQLVRIALEQYRDLAVAAPSRPDPGQTGVAGGQTGG